MLFVCRLLIMTQDTLLLIKKWKVKYEKSYWCTVSTSMFMYVYCIARLCTLLLSIFTIHYNINVIMSMRPGKDRPVLSIHCWQPISSPSPCHGKQHDLEIFKNRVFLLLQCPAVVWGETTCLTKAKLQLIIWLSFSSFINISNLQKFSKSFSKSMKYFSVQYPPNQCLPATESSLLPIAMSTYLDNSRLVHLITLLAFKVSAIFVISS